MTTDTMTQLGELLTAPEAPEELAPGLHDGIPEARYHRLAGASQSRLKVLRELSPAHLRWQMDHPGEASPAQVLGAAIHDAVLLPDLFDAGWKQGIEGDGRTKAVKEARAALEAEHPNATVLSPADYDTCLAVRDAIAAHPKARQLLIGKAEQTAVWLDPETGVLCRGRFDLLGRRTGTIVDLKTTRCAAEESFSRDTWNYGYHIQAAHYLAGARALGLDFDKFAFVTVEKEPPYAVALYDLSTAAIYDGGRELRPLLNLYAECERTGTWPSYSTDIRTLDIPEWAPSKINKKLGEG